MEEKGYITIGADMGDTVAGYTVGTHLRVLRKLLDKYCTLHYSPGLDEFYIVLRVDGDFGYWEFRGCDRLRLMKKKRYITVDIGVPRSGWEGVAAFELRQYLNNCIKQAFTIMVAKLKREKLSIDADALFLDYSKVEQEFLKIDY